MENFQQCRLFPFMERFYRKLIRRMTVLIALIAVEFETAPPAFTSPPGELFPPFPPFPAVAPPPAPLELAEFPMGLLPASPAPLELVEFPMGFASASATASGEFACSGTCSSKMVKTFESDGARLLSLRARESANANEVSAKKIITNASTAYA